MRICIFGDSITWGAYDPENGGWANSLRNDLESKDISVYNCGISADTTDNILRRFRVEAEARDPDIIIFAIGINDSAYFETRDEARVSINDFKPNLEKLISQAKEFVERVIFVGLNNVNEKETKTFNNNNKDAAFDNKNVEIYNIVIKEVASNEKLDFIDLKEVIKLEDLSDGLHPNTEGHKKIFKTVKNFLKHKNLI